MKVLNLRCAQGHGFEGWFGSEDDFQGQLGRGLVECPVCADRAIARMPSAPRLNLGGSRRRDADAAVQAAPAPDAERADGSAVDAQRQLSARASEMQAAWMQAVRHLMAQTEDVGERFAEEARRIHYGERPERGIRGQASAEERAALREEGIETLAIPVPAALKGPVQ